AFDFAIEVVDEQRDVEEALVGQVLYAVLINRGGEQCDVERPERDISALTVAPRFWIGDIGTGGAVKTHRGVRVRHPHSQVRDTCHCHDRRRYGHEWSRATRASPTRKRGRGSRS